MDNSSVLIVEDEAIIAANLTCIVERLGFRSVETAFTADDALSLASQACPGLALIAIDPAHQFNEVRLAKILQDMCGDMPVIFLTCDPDAAIAIERASLTGPYHCIQLPFEKNDVVLQIEKYRTRRSPATSSQIEAENLPAL